ncbi:MAG: ArsR/SmtB family transcription factor [Acidimicrobiales bacterium]
MIDPDRVESVRSSMPIDDDINVLSDVFGLLSDQGRLRLLISLLESGELCVCDLAAATGQNESSVSHALRLLRAHRVVQVRRSGRMSYYRLADSHVRLLLDLGLEHIGHAVTVRMHDGRRS